MDYLVGSLQKVSVLWNVDNISQRTSHYGKQRSGLHVRPKALTKQPACKTKGLNKETAAKSLWTVN